MLRQRLKDKEFFYKEDSYESVIADEDVKSLEAKEENSNFQQFHIKEKEDDKKI